MLQRTLASRVLALMVACTWPVASSAPVQAVLQQNQAPVSLDELYAQAKAHEAKGDFILARALYDEGAARAQAASDNTNLLRFTLSRIEIAYYQSRQKDAIDLADAAERLATAVGDEESVARAVRLRGLAELAPGSLPAAKTDLERALELYERIDSKRDVAITLNGLAIHAELTRDHERAQHFFDSALKLATTIGDESVIAIIRSNRCRLMWTKFDFTAAFAEAEEAVRLAGKTQRFSVLVVALNNLAVAAAGLGRLDVSADCLSRALQNSERFGNQFLRATLNMNLSMIYFKLGRHDESIQLSQRSLALAIEEGNELATARIRSNMAAALQLLSRYDEAIEALSQSLEILKASGTKREYFGARNSLAGVYIALGQYDSAIAILQEVISEASDEEDLVAIATMMLALALHDAGRYEAALERYQESLSALERPGLAHERGRALNNFAMLLVDMGRLDEAEEVARKGFELAEKQKFNKLRVALEEQVGIICRRRGDYERAIEYGKRSVTGALKEGDDLLLGEVHDNLASTYHAAQQLSQAHESFTQALAAYESVLTRVGSPQDVASFFERSLDRVHARFAHLLVDQGQSEDALAVLERGRAPALAKQIAYSGKDWAAVLGREDAAALEAAQKERELAEKLLDVAVEQLATTPPARKAELEAQRSKCEERLAKAEDELRLMESALFAKYPIFKEITGAHGPSVSDLSRLSKSHADTLFLQWSFTDDELLLFELANGRVVAHTLPLDLKHARGLVQDYVEAIRTSDSTEGRMARDLFKALLSPVALSGSLDRAKRLVLVSDGPLLDLPFAALIDGRGRRLIERFSLSSSISFGALTWPGSGRRPTAGGLVVADPTGKSLDQGSNPLAIELGPLPGAKEEGESLTKILPGSLSLHGAAATEERVAAEAPAHAILHFACHGVLNRRKPMLSGLALASADPGRSYSLLEAREVAQLPLSAHLAVLSACDTGRGKSVGGEGLLGLTWAYRAAGVSSVVASHWRVADDSTQRIMVRFYQELRAGRRRDDSLRTAMLAEKRHQEDMRRRGSSSSADLGSAVYFWAPFSLTGDASPIPWSSSPRSGR